MAGRLRRLRNQGFKVLIRKQDKCVAALKNDLVYKGKNVTDVYHQIKK